MTEQTMVYEPKVGDLVRLREVVSVPEATGMLAEVTAASPDWPDVFAATILPSKNQRGNEAGGAGWRVDKAEVEPVEPETSGRMQRLPSGRLNPLTLPQTGSRVVVQVYDGDATRMRWEPRFVTRHDVGDPELPIAVSSEYPEAEFNWVSSWARLDEQVKVEDEPEITSLRRQLTEMQAAVERAERRHETQARTVATVAMRYAKENGWCDTVKDALREMGIEPESPTEVIEVVVRFRFVAQNMSDTATSESWVRQSLSSLDRVELDSDWTTEEFGYDVESVDVSTVD